MKKEKMYQKTGLRILRTVLTLALLMIVMTISAAAEWEDYTIKNWQNCGQPETGFIMFSVTHEPYFNGTHIVSRYVTYGLKDANGNIVLPAEYYSIRYHNGIILLEHENGNDFILSKTLEKIFPRAGDTAQYQDIKYIEQGDIYVATGKNVCAKVLNSTCETIFPRTNDPVHYQNIEYFEPYDAYIVTGYFDGKNSQKKLYDKQFNPIISEPYNSISYFSEDILMVSGSYFDGQSTKSGCGLYKLGTGLIVPTEYGYFWNQAPVIKARKDYYEYGYFDFDGNMIIPCQYAYVGDVYYDFVVVGVFKHPEYREPLIAMGYWSLDLCTVVEGELPFYVGVVDRDGNTIIPFEYENINFDFKNNVVEYGFWTGKTSPGDISGITHYHFDMESRPLSDLETMRPVFSDVPVTSYYNTPVRWALEQGITTGTSDKTFSPDQTCTTAQILTFLWRAYGCPEPTIANPFTNVSADQYFYKAALWAYENGMISGTEFDGSAPCTRARTMLFMWQAAGSPAVRGITSFTDVPADALYAQAVAWAVQNGITTGTSETTFSPDQTCTRGQIVTFLHRAFGA